MDYENPKPFAKPEQVTLPPQRRPNTQAMTPHIKMFISDWFTDELGNMARSSKLVTETALPRIEPRWGSSSPPPVGRWGINAGESLGHHHARDYRRPMWAPGSHNPPAEACCALRR